MRKHLARAVVHAAMNAGSVKGCEDVLVRHDRGWGDSICGSGEDAHPEKGSLETSLGDGTTTPGGGGGCGVGGHEPMAFRSASLLAALTGLGVMTTIARQQRRVKARRRKV